MKWEYKKVPVTHDHQDLEKVLNELGKDRWELTTAGLVQGNFSSSDSVLLLFFKREILEPPDEPRQATTEQVLAYMHGLGEEVSKSSPAENPAYDPEYDMGSSPS